MEIPLSRKGTSELPDCLADSRSCGLGTACGRPHRQPFKLVYLGPTGAQILKSEFLLVTTISSSTRAATAASGHLDTAVDHSLLRRLQTSPRHWSRVLRTGL